MAARTLPGLGMKAFWTAGDDSWEGDPGMDGNLRMASILTQLGVISRVASVPGSPSDGDIHIITSGADTNKIAARDNGAWVYYTPSEGWLARDKATDEFIYFDGATWTPLLASVGLDYEYLGKVSGSNVSSLDITSLIVSGYTEFEFHLENMYVHSGSLIYLRASTDNGSSFVSTSGAYAYYRNIRNLATGNTDGGSAFSATQVVITPSGVNASNYIQSGIMRVVDPLNALFKTMFIMPGGQIHGEQSGANTYVVTDVYGQRNTAAADNAFRFLANTGNITGTVRVWGRKAT